MEYTINLRTNNTEQFDAFLSFVKSFGLVDVIDIKMEETIFDKNNLYYDESLILAPQKRVLVSKYYGFWEDKDIGDIKQFREGLWQRK
ncbi:MAG: hypothetical protein DRI95_09255 [Bacteroidetes bacterium]|nr:MAG: hypothetical protein DRI95_09255 [Bacteroidota bacterium]